MVNLVDICTVIISCFIIFAKTGVLLQRTNQNSKAL